MKKIIGLIIVVLLTLTSCNQTKKENPLEVFAANLRESQSFTINMMAKRDFLYKINLDVSFKYEKDKMYASYYLSLKDKEYFNGLSYVAKTSNTIIWYKQTNDSYIINTYPILNLGIFDLDIKFNLKYDNFNYNDELQTYEIKEDLINNFNNFIKYYQTDFTLNRIVVSLAMENELTLKADLLYQNAIIIPVDIKIDSLNKTIIELPGETNA